MTNLLSAFLPGKKPGEKQCLRPQPFFCGKKSVDKMALPTVFQKAKGFLLEFVSMLNSFYDKFIFTNALRYTHYNFFLLNVPFSIVPVDVLVGFARISDAQANRHIYAAIKDQVSHSLVQSFQLGNSVEKSLLFLEEFFTASGWGLVKQVDIDQEKKRAIMVVDDNPIGRALQGNASKAVDHVFRGIFAGLFSHLFEANVDCIEHECAALGHPRCEFIIKKQPDFDFSKEEPREQLVLTD